MDGFVARQNIEHYRAMLKSTTDPEKRRLIEQLLFDEEAKLKNTTTKTTKSKILRLAAEIAAALVRTSK